MNNKSKNDTIMVTPSTTRSLRKNFSVTPVTKRTSQMTTDIPRLKPVLKPPPSSSVKRDIGVCTTPPRKKSDSGRLSDTATLIGSNRESLVIDPPHKEKKVIHSLQSIKQKFMLKEQPLPWEQYVTLPNVNCQQQQQQQQHSDYEDMIQQLNVSHALGVSVHFKTMSFVDADKLIQKYDQLKQVIETMYAKIRVYSDTTRATIMTLKLDAPQNKHLCQLNEYAIEIEHLLDEFHFTSKYAKHLQKTYLEHLAGTLCHHRDNSDLLEHILIRLKTLCEEVILPSPSSSNTTIASHCNSSVPPVYQQIDIMLKKIAFKLKMNTNAPTNKPFDPTTHDELIKQRERSASLVFELEKTISNRISQTQEKETELVNLREQLMQETLSRQSLQDRVIELEIRMKKEHEEALETKLQHKKDMKISLDNKPNKNEDLVSCNQSRSNDNDSLSCNVALLLEQHKAQELNQVKDQIIQQQNDLVLQLNQEKNDWLETKKSILNQCYTVIDSRQEDLQLAVQHLIEKLMTNKEEEEKKRNKTLQPKEIIHNNIVPLENQALLETNLKNDNLLISKQEKEIIDLKNEYNEIIKLYHTRESAYILQSASTEAELERVLKEYDRLTRNIIDFNSERKKFENEIRNLSIENLNLSRELSVEKINHIQGNDCHLRKEFMNLMTLVKKKHEQELIQLMDINIRLEHDLREKMSDIEMKRWEKVDIAVQTNIQFPF